MKKMIVVLAFLCLGFTYRGVNEEVIPVDDTCVLYLDMESINSTEVHDLSQSHNNGTISGATRTVDQYGQYLSFDGTNDYVDCGNDTSINIGTGDFSISAWVKYSVKGHMIAGKYCDNTNPGYWLSNTQATWENQLAIRVSDAGGSYCDRATTSLYNDNNWHHVVGVVDRDVNPILIYIDGVAVATTGVGDLSTETGDLGTGAFQIGGNTHTDDYFSGSIDDVRIFSRALTAQEIIDLFENTRGKYGR